MTKEIEATSVLFCDDVRREASGKDIVIGVYAGVILFPALPSTLPNFAVRIEFKTTLESADDLTVEMRGPEGETLFSITGYMEMVGKDGVQVLSVITHNVTFAREGVCTLFFGRKDRMEPVHTIPVRVEPMQITMPA